MATQISNKALRLLFVMSFVAALPAIPAAAATAPAPQLVGGDTARSDAGKNFFQAGCGDGICDPYMGEDTSACPQDCMSGTAVTPFRVVTRTPTSTLSLSATATATAQETLALSTETPVPMEATATPLAGGVLTLPGCDLVAYESREQAWQKGYGGQASPGSFVPLRSDNREVYVCVVPPVGQICIPIYQGLIKASQVDIQNIVLVDCATNGSCNVYPGPGKQVGEAICFDVAQAEHLSCSAGCALAPRQEATFVLPLLGNVPTRILAPTACLAALLILGMVLGIIFVTRRSRGREHPLAGATQPPYGWDSISQAPGTPSKGTSGMKD